ncbi:MAG: hypothetical protein LBM74_02195 [Oscillospiraceae bacterium]|jgi:hypothetical protein|nr:hypothetical protein [Oscillospiraceae bacterium]
MKMTDEQIRRALNHRLSALNDPARPARILNRIAQEEEPIYMKKKMTRALALTLVSALVLTTAALATTGNLFELFGQHDSRYTYVAGQATLTTTDVPGALPIRFERAYYDGLSLTATILAENPPEVVDFTPSAEELSAMTVYPRDWRDLPEIYLIGAEVSAWEALQEAVHSRTPYGYQVTTYDPVAFVTTEDGIEIPLAFGDESWDEQGRWGALREAELPLPEELRNLPAITLRNEIMRVQWAWYFDGEWLYRSEGAGESDGFTNVGVSESVGFITATVPLAEGALQQMTGSSIANGTEVTASADVTAMAAVVTLSAEETLTVGDLLPVDQQPPAGTDALDVWVEVTAQDETGRRFRGIEGLMADQALPISIPLLGVGELPGQLTVEIKLQWEGEGNVGTGFVMGLEQK